MIEVRVLKSQRRRTVTLRCGTRGKIEVLSPAGLSQQELEALVRARRAWVLRVTEQAPDPGPERVLAHGEPLLLLGETVCLHIGSAPAGRIAVKEGPGTLTALVPSDASLAHLRGALEAWYRRKARRVFGERVDLYGQRMGLRPTRLTIRGPRFRWGSCGASGQINFCWRVVMAPLWVVDYLVVHELAHLSVRGHGSDFWRLVDAFAPGGRQGRQWLHENGARLHL